MSMHHSELMDKLHMIAQRAETHWETLETSFLLARNVIERGIPGELVECGVYRGAQAAAMALALQLTPNIRQRRRVHLFDSFQGMPPANQFDLEFLAERKQPGEACCSLQSVQSHMAQWEIDESLLVYHPGWFSETVKLWGLLGWGEIALLRLDGDLYESTRDCMALYPYVTRGGWVIVDDWNLSGCRKAVEEAVIPKPMYFQKLP